MFEGQNIHLSPIDGKRLCSFSRKICKQRRLNGYAFCIRHILEDRNAPFKQCQFKTKCNGEKCINPVPMAAERIYCNSHLQVLGLLPKHCSKKQLEKKSFNRGKKDEKRSKLLSESYNNKPTSKIKTMQKKIMKQTIKNNEIINEPNVKMKNWHLEMLKLFKCASRNKKLFEKQLLDHNVASLKTAVINNQHCGSHLTGEKYYIKEEESKDVFQSLILISTERVHHNTLCTDTAATQETKIMCKLKHQYSQLKQVFLTKRDKNELSYSVLSKLVSAAQNDVIQTANVLKLNRNANFHNVYRNRSDETLYKVPCSMMVDNIKCTNDALPYMRHCKHHCTQDSDQHLFSESCSPTVDVLCFLQDRDPLHKRNIVTARTRTKQRKHLTGIRKTISKKKTRLKKVSPRRESQSYDKFSSNKIVSEENDDDSNVIEASGSSTSEQDIDIQEETFHSPTHSAFSINVDDEDSLSNMRNINCELDDDDEEIIRCNNRYSYESTTNLTRDLSSPTLNQLSSSDFDTSLRMFMSSGKTLGLASVVSPMTATFLSSFSSAGEKTCNTTTSKSKHFPQAEIETHQTTSLKISPLNSTHRKMKFSSNYTPANFSNGPLVTGSQNVGTKSLNTNQHETNNTAPHSFQNGHAFFSTKHDDNGLNKRYLNDPFLLKQSLCDGTSLFDDIITEADSPLEKVNPDIFFSSAFPISTSTANNLTS